VSKVQKLSELGLRAAGGKDVRVTGLTADSREVKPGFLFAALPGTKAHGADFIPAALAAGAASILTDGEGASIAGDALQGASAALVIAEEPRAALAGAAALFFGAQPEVMVAVTGTNGKTSVASFARQIWTLLGHEAVNIGTTGIEGAYSAPSLHTTPDPITLHRHLATMAADGVTHAAMEASSHGLDQYRLDGVRLMAAAFTNFSQDHLDYHHTFDAYFEAKAGLFTRVLPEDGVAVINIDDRKCEDLIDLCIERDVEVLAFGQGEMADLRILSQRYDALGQILRFGWENEIHQTRLALIGGFQAANVLAAAGLCIASGSDPKAVFGTLSRLTTVRGRMQLAATRRNGATVYVDYAHTPDAVKTALKALRPHVMGKIVAIVGAGGDRDTTKRPLMGQAAATYADQVIVTDDNPRSEDPGLIRRAVIEGAPGALEVGDRAEAILRGVDALDPGDALIICGKGHESGQTIGGVTYPFDDAEQASISVAALDGIRP
jgi:UDP-N-acetylmuramoyl-L-alanyl-D-glutamate--2,6-diaminopimelate ligase